MQNKECIMLDVTAAKQTLKQRFKPKSSSSTSKTPVDCEVLIIGAGIAGIGMACRLQQQKHKGLFGRYVGFVYISWYSFRF